ncbi:MAG: metallopeptidase TldD-related protein [Burkholderiaceae bacterium]|jgi:PmbA protein
MSLPSRSDYFTYSPEKLRQLADDALAHARAVGASDCVVEVSEGRGLSVNVRKGEVETIEQNQDKGISLTVYLGTGKAVRRGNASTSDFSSRSLKETVEAAYNIARFTAPDDCAGLPEDELFDRAPQDFDLFYPWDLGAEEAVELGRAGESAAYAVSPMVRNSDGASVSVQHGHFLSANSRGFVGGYPYSRHSIAVSAIASRNARGSADLQRDDWYVSARDPADLPAPEKVGTYAAQRALARLGSRKISTRHAPVLFEAPLATGLLGAFAQAASGSALYRKSSFLVDGLGESLFAPHIDIVDDPFIVKGMGSASFDEEGVRTQRRVVVERGTLKGYFLSCYSGRKLGLPTTGNAGGSHNLSITSSLTSLADDFEGMLRRLGRGLLVTDLLGQGVNYVTGDYSRGATGFWVEDGVIVHPVEEITIAGNLREIFAGIAAVGADVIVRGNKSCGSILIDDMMIAGD